MKLFNWKKNKGGLWTAQFGEVVASLAILEKAGLTVEMLKKLREKNGEETAKKIVALFLEAATVNAAYGDLKKSWQDFYAKYFDLTIDLSEVKIPTVKAGLNRLLIIVPGISPNKVVVAQRSHFKTWVYTEDLDAAIIHNDRDASSGPYAIWVRDTVEPDQRYRSRSASWAKENNISGETLLERLIHGLKYWDEKGKHLDINGITLCTGSRYSDGCVPNVDFYSDGKVSVRWSIPTMPVAASASVRQFFVQLKACILKLTLFHYEFEPIHLRIGSFFVIVKLG